MYSSAAEDYCEQIRKLTAEMTKTADSQPEKEEKKPLQSEKPTTLDDRIDTFFRVLFSQINQKNKGKNWKNAGKRRQIRAWQVIVGVVKYETLKGKEK